MLIGTTFASESISKLNDYCSENEIQCGTSAICVDNRCRCQFGFIQAQNQFNCLRVMCEETIDCEEIPNTICHKPTGRCVCDQDSVLVNEMCQSKRRHLDEQCGSENYCGLNAKCIDDRCKCLMGYIANEDQINCDSLLCQQTDDCMQYGLADCVNNHCICNVVNQIDTSKQICVPIPSVVTVSSVKMMTTTLNTSNVETNNLMLNSTLSNASFVESPFCTTTTIAIVVSSAIFVLVCIIVVFYIYKHFKRLEIQFV